MVAGSVCKAYPGSIGRLPIFLIVVSDLVKIVLVKLAHKTGKVAVLEVLGEDVLGELFVLSRS